MYTSLYGEIEEEAITYRIIATFKEDTEIIYEGETFNDFNDLKSKLGDNYITDLPYGYYTNTITITYIDRVNNILLAFEILKDNSVDIIVKRIDDNYDRIASKPLLYYYYSPFDVFDFVQSKLNSVSLFHPLDFIILPIYFSLVLYPIVLLIIERNKSNKKRLIVLNIILLIVYIVMWLPGWWGALMSV